MIILSLDLFSNNIILYHGNNDKHIVPVYRKVEGKEDLCDYGTCFYTTDKEEDAHAWGFSRSTLPFVHKYNLPLNDLKVVDIRQFSTLEWIITICHFRKVSFNLSYSEIEKLELLEKKYFIEDVLEADVIISYRADDVLFDVIREFVTGRINMKRFEAILYNTQVGVQYCLRSELALDSLEYIITVEADIMYSNIYNELVDKGYASYSSVMNNNTKEYIEDEIYFRDII